MEKRNNNMVFAVIITILVMIIIGLIAFIILDKPEEEINEPNIEENNKENEEQLENYDYSKITEELNNNLQDFMTYKLSTYKSLNTSDSRLSLINSLLGKSDKVMTYDKGTVQPFPYVSYDEYKKLYLEVYGNNYSFENDLSSASDAVVSTNNKYLGTGYISWNNTGSALGNYILTAENINYDETTKIYVLSGKYTVENSNESATFEITYNKLNSVNYLKNITIN